MTRQTVVLTFDAADDDTSDDRPSLIYRIGQLFAVQPLAAHGFLYNSAAFINIDDMDKLRKDNVK